MGPRRGRLFHMVTPLQRRDQADRFMAGNKRKRGLQGPVPVSSMEIGVADAARLRLDHDLSNSRSGYVPLAKHERFPELLNHCCVHLFCCHGESSFQVSNSLW